MTNDSLIDRLENFKKEKRFDVSGISDLAIDGCIDIIRQYTAAPDAGKAWFAYRAERANLGVALNGNDSNTFVAGFKAAIVAMEYGDRAPQADVPVSEDASTRKDEEEIAMRTSGTSSDCQSEISVVDCKFAFDTFLIEEVGPIAIAGDKISIHDAAWMAWQACWKVRAPKPVSVAQCVAAYSMSVPENDRPQNIYEQGIEAVLNAAGVAYGK